MSEALNSHKYCGSSLRTCRYGLNNEQRLTGKHETCDMNIVSVQGGGRGCTEHCAQVLSCALPCSILVLTSSSSLPLSSPLHCNRVACGSTGA
eukprot:1150751-Pelagomonas_calceolata.AAC.10